MTRSYKEELGLEYYSIEVRFDHFYKARLLPVGRYSCCSHEYIEERSTIFFKTCTIRNRELSHSVKVPMAKGFYSFVTLWISSLLHVLWKRRLTEGDEGHFVANQYGGIVMADDWWMMTMGDTDSEASILTYIPVYKILTSSFGVLNMIFKVI